jgi:hypothetical protein
MVRMCFSRGMWSDSYNRVRLLCEGDNAVDAGTPYANASPS